MQRYPPEIGASRMKEWVGNQGVSSSSVGLGSFLETLGIVLQERRWGRLSDSQHRETAPPRGARILEGNGRFASPWSRTEGNKGLAWGERCTLASRWKTLSRSECSLTGAFRFDRWKGRLASRSASMSAAISSRAVSGGFSSPIHQYADTRRGPRLGNFGSAKRSMALGTCWIDRALRHRGLSGHLSAAL